MCVVLSHNICSNLLCVLVQFHNQKVDLKYKCPIKMDGSLNHFYERFHLIGIEGVQQD
jgi:hypothetical protein